MVRVADAAAGQTDLAEHGGEHGAHPVGLLAVLLALHRPAEDELGAVLGHQAGEFADALCRHAADLLGPLGRLLDLVFDLAFEVGQEAVEAQRVGVEEFLVVQAFLHQRVRDGEHQRQAVFAHAAFDDSRERERRVLEHRARALRGRGRLVARILVRFQLL